MDVIGDCHRFCAAEPLLRATRIRSRSPRSSLVASIRRSVGTADAEAAEATVRVRGMGLRIPPGPVAGRQIADGLLHAALMCL